ncbi:hypothetical protein [Lactococcus lactis]|uniref:hypothetical protein n=1 Tax=Lactococcus lactis TaxID=1358 RepID=UPI00223AA231|nr:hypothetical protein [Lactococcus lactis]
MSHSEQMIENQFIQILSEKENQWTYRPDLKSEEALWQNGSVAKFSKKSILV